MLKKSETLVIGYDMTDGLDMSALAISRVENSKLTVVNIFYGEEADSMYNQLTTCGGIGNGEK